MMPEVNSLAVPSQVKVPRQSHFLLLACNDGSNTSSSILLSNIPRASGPHTGRLLRFLSFHKLTLAWLSSSGKCAAAALVACTSSLIVQCGRPQSTVRCRPVTYKAARSPINYTSTTVSLTLQALRSNSEATLWRSHGKQVSALATRKCNFLNT